MRPWIKRGVTLFSALLLTLGLLGLMILVSDPHLQRPDTAVVREIQFALPPPPPPPPSMQIQQPAELPSLDISISGEGPGLTSTPTMLNAVIEVEEITPPEPKALTPDWHKLLQPDWDTVGLEQLDAPPRLLTSLKIEYPKALSRQGVNKIKLEADVLIDETGKVILRQILGTPPAEIVEPLKTLVNRARFTAPQKDGVAVRAAFIWPLEFSND